MEGKLCLGRNLPHPWSFALSRFLFVVFRLTDSQVWEMFWWWNSSIGNLLSRYIRRCFRKVLPQFSKALQYTAEHFYWASNQNSDSWTDNSCTVLRRLECGEIWHCPCFSPNQDTSCLRWNTSLDHRLSVVVPIDTYLSQIDARVTPQKSPRKGSSLPRQHLTPCIYLIFFSHFYFMPRKDHVLLLLGRSSVYRALLQNSSRSFNIPWTSESCFWIDRCNPHMQLFLSSTRPPWHIFLRIASRSFLISQK